MESRISSAVRSAATWLKGLDPAWTGRRRGLLVAVVCMAADFLLMAFLHRLAAGWIPHSWLDWTVICCVATGVRMSVTFGITRAFRDHAIPLERASVADELRFGVPRVFGIGGLIVGAALSSLVVLVAAGVKLPPPDTRALVNHGHWEYGVACSIVTGLGAMGEEWIFRSICLSRLLASCPVGVAIVLNASCFAAMHGAGGGVVKAEHVLGGFVFAGAYAWRRSLVLPILLHVGANVLVTAANVLHVVAYRQSPGWFLGG